MKDRKKPVEVEVMQFNRNNFDEIVKFTNGKAMTFRQSLYTQKGNVGARY